jgi:proteasome lid subunit RPN8/RPN11
MVTWSVPQCPFTIECSARTLDDIRLVVTDAFFSLARGGLEVGGILLGTCDGNRLSVLEYAPLDCEHAYGPTFNISPNDRARMRQLLASAPADHPGLQVVGWYHSHTRSGIFLSEEDLDLYDRYFPEAWQIALVMKPHTFDPARIGFFFRGADGTVHAKESYQEMVLDPLPAQKIPTQAPGPPPASKTRADSPRSRASRRSSQLELEITAEPVPMEAEPPATPLPEVEPPPKPAAATASSAVRVPEPEPAPPPPPPPPPPPVVEKALPRRFKPRPEPEPEREPERPVVEHRLPAFAVEKKPSGRGKIVAWIVLGAAATLAILFGAVKTREMWIPKLTTAARPPVEVPLPPPSMGLKTGDRDGQLEIDWDRLSILIRQGVSARLEISDGSAAPQSIPLDGPHLQAGVFTYGRQSEKVDVKLIVRNSEGKEAVEATTYIGKLPDRKPPEESEEVRKAREAMAAQAAKLKADLNFQAAKTRKLEKQLQELRQQQQKRMQNQIEGK